MLFSAAAAAQESKQESKPNRVLVTGQVLDRITREPIVGAHVELAKIDRDAFTNEYGLFAMKNVPVGSYEVTVEQFGYATLNVNRTFGEESSPFQLELAPDPVQLKAIEVVNDRLARRRQTATTSVFAYEGDRLHNNAAFDAEDFIRMHTFTTPCRGFSFGSTCVIRRGRVVQPRVYIDEVLTPAGMDFLSGLSTQDLYLVEIYANGAQIRVYTNWFARNLAQGRAHLDPVILF
jgi:hypothetical protein